MNNIGKKHHNGVFKRLLSIIMAVSIVITGLNLENIISNAATGTTQIYLVDNTAEKWLDNDNAVLELVDNSNGHDHYAMTKIDENIWQATVPTSATNITFNRLSPNGNTQWNSFSAGGRGINNAYYADGAEYGHWEATEVEEEENYFHIGDIIYLDVSEFVSWEQDNAKMYINFTGVSKKENSGNDIDISSADKSIYNPKYVGIEITEHVYAYVVTFEDEGATELRFWRGNDYELWNCSVVLKYDDFVNGMNCVKISNWNDLGRLAIKLFR